MNNIKREEQEVNNTWDLSLLYKSIDEYNADFKKVKDLIKNLSKYNGNILTSSENLYNLLELDTAIDRLLEKLATYEERKYDEDISNTSSQELHGKFNNLYHEYSSISSFIVPEMLKSEFSLVEKYISEDERLKKYELLLKRIFRYKEHTLSENEEKIISELSDSLSSSSRIAGIIRNSELQFGKIKDENDELVELNNENFSLYLKSKDRRVRHDAFTTLYNDYSKYKDTLAECLKSFVHSNNKIAMLKHYKNSREDSLFANRVNEEIYDNLIETTNKRLDVLYKYYNLKKDILKLDDFNIYDTYVNLSDVNNKEYTFDDAKKIVLDVVKVFGSDYVKKIESAFDNRWIDIYPNISKRGGAYSSGGFDTPPYMLLNFQNKYYDISTLIHELGHSMHSMYSKENNDYLYYSYKIFVAEVASTVNELLFNYYMLDNTDDIEEKKFILSEMMDDFKATMYRQTMFAEFEKQIYEEDQKGTILTSEFLNNSYLDLNKKYYGPGVRVDVNIKYEWMRIPHFYYHFYVYQYATGISSACYIVNRIRNGEDGAIEDYLRFLKSGDSMDPVEELKLAHVDITDPSVINGAIDMFESWIDEYSSLMKNK